MRFASLDSIARSAGAALRRFPLTLAFAGLACAVTDLLILVEGDHPRLVSVAVVATLGIALSLAATLFLERRGSSLPPAARAMVLPIVTVVLAFLATRWSHWAEEVQWRRYAQIALLGHALVAVLPYVRVREPNGFWQYNRILLERFIVATVFAGVLQSGLMGALAALKPLFGIAVSPKAYALLFTWVSFVFHPWFFLAGIPQDLSSLESRSEYPATLRVFAQFILVPLVAVYQLLLTAYLVKVVTTGQWPSGLIGLLVSFEAAAGMLALLLIHPVRDQAGNLWVRTFSRGFYIALLPSIAMLAVSIAKRVGQYGVTEDRYFVIVLTGWLAAISLTFIARRDSDIRIIPLTLAALALVTLAGPWGAYGVSLRSQRAHLVRVLQTSGLWLNGRFAASDQPVPPATTREISSTITYLIRTHGSRSLRNVFPDQIAAADSGFVRGYRGAADQRARQLMARCGLAYVNPWEAQQTEAGNFSFQLPYVDANEATHIEGVQYHVRMDGPVREIVADGRRFRLAVDEPRHRVVLIELHGRPGGAPQQSGDTLAAMPLDSAVAISRRGRPAAVSTSPLLLTMSGDGAHGIAHVTYLNGRERPMFAVYGLSGDLYFTLGPARADSK